MKNKITMILVILLIISCNEKIEYYHGVITDKQGKPLYGVRVEKINFRAKDSSKRFTYTNKKGYFKFKSDPVWSDISLSKKGFNKRIIKPMMPIHGEYIQYTFVNKENDTVIMCK